MDQLQQADPVAQAFLATSLTWLLTAIEAAVVFVTNNTNRKILDGPLGFSAGVMLAATYWSLLAPAIAIARSNGSPAWLRAAAGVLVGGMFLFAADRILPHLHFDFPREAAEGIPTHWRGTTLLVLAITLHNIPGGLAVGRCLRRSSSRSHIRRPISGNRPDHRNRSPEPSRGPGCLPSAAATRGLPLEKLLVWAALGCRRTSRRPSWDRCC